MKTLLILATTTAMGFATGACGDEDDGGGSKGKATCQSACANSAAAECANEQSEADCVAECEPFLEGACSEEFQAVLDCSSSKTVTCDDYGEASVAGCDAEGLAFVDCAFGS